MNSENVYRWASIINFFSTLFVVFGGVLRFLVLSVPRAQFDDMKYSKLYSLSVMLIEVGMIGLIAAFTRSKLLLKLKVALMAYLSFLIAHVVLTHVYDDNMSCPVTISSVHAEHRAIFLETMPGLYIEVGRQYSYVVRTVTAEECNEVARKLIQKMWVHSVFLLLTLLFSSSLACLRLLVAIRKQEEADEVDAIEKEGLLNAAADCDEDEALYDVFTSAKEVPMPPPQAEEPKAVQMNLPTLELPTMPDVPAAFPLVKPGVVDN